MKTNLSVFDIYIYVGIKVVHFFQPSVLVFNFCSLLCSIFVFNFNICEYISIAVRQFNSRFFPRK